MKLTAEVYKCAVLTVIAVLLAAILWRMPEHSKDAIVSEEIRRFVPINGTSQGVDIAMDTKIGTLCKSWDWKSKDEYNSLRTCFDLYNLYK